MSLKVAIIGCGKISDGHIEEIQKMPNKAKIVAVCDRELLMAEQIAVRYGIKAFYDDFDRLLEVESPDVVHVTTPPQSHLPLACRALAAGCHVYVEKPLTVNHCDTERLVSLAIESNRKLTVGYSNMFDPAATMMREIIAEGILGDPIHVESFLGYNLGGPFGAAMMADNNHWVHGLPGGVIQNNLDHMVYKITEFVQDDTPNVYAFGEVRRAERYGDARDQMADELRIMIQGRDITGYGTFSSHARPLGHFTRIYGTKNTLHVDYSARTVALDVSPKLPSAIGRLLPAFQQSWQYLRAGRRNLKSFAAADFHFFTGLNRLISQHYDSILQDTPPPIDYRDILRISRLMDEIFRQIGVNADRGMA